MFNARCGIFVRIFKLLWQAHQDYFKICTWTSSAIVAFDNLKQAFTFIPISVHVDLIKLVFMEVDKFGIPCNNMYLAPFHWQKHWRYKNQLQNSWASSCLLLCSGTYFWRVLLTKSSCIMIISASHVSNSMPNSWINDKIIRCSFESHVLIS